MHDIAVSRRGIKMNNQHMTPSEKRMVFCPINCPILEPAFKTPIGRLCLYAAIQICRIGGTGGELCSLGCPLDDGSRAAQWCGPRVTDVSCRQTWGKAWTDTQDRCKNLLGFMKVLQISYLLRQLRVRHEQSCFCPVTHLQIVSLTNNSYSHV